MSREYDELKEALKHDGASAVEAMSQYVATRKQNSKPMFVTLGLNKAYPTAVEVKDLPQAMANNADLLDLLKKVIK